MGEPQRRGLGGPADVLSRRVLERAIDHAGPVEASDHGHAARHRGRLESAHLLQPPEVQLDVGADRYRRVEARNSHQVR
jgi:hypothetical protein